MSKHIQVNNILFRFSIKKTFPIVPAKPINLDKKNEKESVLFKMRKGNKRRNKETKNKNKYQDVPVVSHPAGFPNPIETCDAIPQPNSNLPNTCLPPCLVNIVCVTSRKRGIICHTRYVPPVWLRSCPGVVTPSPSWTPIVKPR